MCPITGKELSWPPDELSVGRSDGQYLLSFRINNNKYEISDVAVDLGYDGDEMGIRIQDDLFIAFLRGELPILTKREFLQYAVGEDVDSPDKVNATWDALAESVCVGRENFMLPKILNYAGYASAGFVSQAIGYDNILLVLQRLVREYLARDGQVALATCGSPILDKVWFRQDLEELIQTLTSEQYGR